MLVSYALCGRVGRVVCYGIEAIAGGHLLRGRAEVGHATAIASGGVVPAVDGYGG